MYVFAIFGLALIVVGAITLLCTVMPRKKCTTMLYGRCAGCQRVHGVRGARVYAPIFEFSFNGKMYKTVSRSTIRDGFLATYQPGTVHPIWVDENNPNTLISNLQYSYKENLNLACSGILFFHGLSLTIVGFGLELLFRYL